MTDPVIITEFFRRYYTQAVGIEPTDHTNRFIGQLFATAIEGLILMKSKQMIGQGCFFRCEEYTLDKYLG